VGVGAWLAAAALAVLAQIVLGALQRHTGGALACVDLPLCHGSLWPAGAALPLKLHMAHRIAGVLVGALVIGVAFQAVRVSHGRPWPRFLALLAPVLVAVQVALGVLAIHTFRSTPIVVAHLGVGALLWAVLVLLWLATAARAPASTARGLVDLTEPVGQGS
jgi:cytochrome c oxidase assembly protein subunit 15